MDDCALGFQNLCREERIPNLPNSSPMVVTGNSRFVEAIKKQCHLCFTQQYSFNTTVHNFLQGHINVHTQCRTLLPILVHWCFNIFRIEFFYGWICWWSVFQFLSFWINWNTSDSSCLHFGKIHNTVVAEISCHKLFLHAFSHLYMCVCP